MRFNACRRRDQSSSRFTFKDVVPGVKNYGRLAGAIDWLNTAGLILKVPICEHAETPIAAYSKENLFKMYMFDVGILGAMLAIPASAVMQYDFGTYKGYYAENFVAQELRSGNADAHIMAWAEKRAEIEFLLQGNTGPIPVEVKSATRVRSQSLKVFRERYAPKTSIILSGREPSDEHDAHGRKLCLPLYLTQKVWGLRG